MNRFRLIEGQPAASNEVCPCSRHSSEQQSSGAGRSHCQCRPKNRLTHSGVPIKIQFISPLLFLKLIKHATTLYRTGVFKEYATFYSKALTIELQTL